MLPIPPLLGEPFQQPLSLKVERVDFIEFPGVARVEGLNQNASRRVASTGCWAAEILEAHGFREQQRFVKFSSNLRFVRAPA